MIKSCHIRGRSLLQVLHYSFLTYIADLLIKALLVVGPLEGPRVQTCQFHRPILTDEDVHGSDISQFLPPSVKVLCGREKCISKVPEFIFFEVLGTEALSIVYLITEDEWIVLVDELTYGENIPPRILLIHRTLNDGRSAVWAATRSPAPLIFQANPSTNYTPSQMAVPP